MYLRTFVTNSPVFTALQEGLRDERAMANAFGERLKKAHGGGDDADFQEALDAVTSELQAEVDGGAD